MSLLVTQLSMELDIPAAREVEPEDRASRSRIPR